MRSGGRHPGGSTRRAVVVTARAGESDAARVRRDAFDEDALPGGAADAVGASREGASWAGFPCDAGAWVARGGRDATDAIAWFEPHVILLPGVSVLLADARARCVVAEASEFALERRTRWNGSRRRGR